MDTSNSILRKIPNYEILTNIIPGFIFLAIVKIVASYGIAQKSFVNEVVAAYLLGMLCGRFGSVLIEPLLFRCFKTCTYKDYVLAEKKDETLKEISTKYALYRGSLAAILLASLFIAWYLICERVLHTKVFCAGFNIVFLLFVIFLAIASCKKQAEYISARVKTINEDK